MADARVEQLAQVLLTYSVNLQPGERVLLDIHGPSLDLARALIRGAYELGGEPHVTLNQPIIQRDLLLGATPEQMKRMAAYELERLRVMDAYIGVRGSDNINELSDVPGETLQAYSEHFVRPVHLEERVPNTRWTVLRYPSPSMAQQAGMSTDAFTDFFFDVCCLDYAQLAGAMEALKARMEEADRVEIRGPGTDLRFSIKGIPAIACAGEHNIPDGEVFTAPVRDSVEGTVTFNTPSVYQGFTFENVRLTFEAGRIVDVDGNDVERLNNIFDTDEGSRYVGEWAIGCNPFIRRPMKDTLFDEKIDGSFHMALGASYDQASNGNKSAIHWDLVAIQRPEYGGGEIRFDGELIRRDGRFVTPDLKPLNPENFQRPDLD